MTQTGNSAMTILLWSLSLNPLRNPVNWQRHSSEFCHPRSETQQTECIDEKEQLSEKASCILNFFYYDICSLKVNHRLIKPHM